MKMASKGHKHHRVFLNLSRVTEFLDVDSHVIEMPEAGSRDRVTLLQLHTVAVSLEAF